MITSSLCLYCLDLHAQDPEIGPRYQRAASKVAISAWDLKRNEDGKKENAWSLTIPLNMRLTCSKNFVVLFFGIANIACTFRFYKFCLVSKIVDSISIVHPLPKKGMIQHDKADSFLQKGSHTQKPGLVQHRHHADSLPLS